MQTTRPKGSANIDQVPDIKQSSRMVNVSNELSPISSGASLDRTYSSTSPGCLITLRSGECGGQFSTLISLSPSIPSLNSFCSVIGHIFLLGAPLPSGSANARIGCICLDGLYTYECHYPMFPSRTLDCNKMMNVIHLTS